MAKDNKTLIQKKIASPKGFLALCAVLGAGVDIAALVSLFALGVVDVFNYIVLFLIAIIDILFIVMVAVTNFRYTYSRKTTVLQIVMIVLVTVASALLTGPFQGGEVFTTTAIVAWWVVHGVTVACYVLTTLYATKKAIKSVIVPAICSVVMLAVTVLYSVMLGSVGFYGQGNSRPVVFAKNGDTYTARRLVSGWSENAVIPTEFNGVEVIGVTTTVFDNDNLKTVTVENKSAELIMDDYNDSPVANQNITVNLSRETVNAFRNAVYEQYGWFTLGNNMRPFDIEDDEICVTFAYDKDSYSTARKNDTLLDIYIGGKGEPFDVSGYAQSSPSLVKNNADSVEDIEWNIENNDRKIFRGFVKDGESISGKELTSSVYGVEMGFDDIFVLTIENDNDDFYEINNSFRYSAGRTVKYATSGNIDQKFSECEQRDGFDLIWLIDGEEVTSTFREEMAGVEGNSATVTPFWSLRAPTLNSFEVTAKGKLTYGDTATFTATATAPCEEVKLRYIWYNPDGEEIAQTNLGEFSKTNLYPNDKGEYKLVVEAYADSADEFTSLTSKKETSKRVEVAPKELNITWNTPSDLTYSAQDKPVTAVYDISDVINGDNIVLRQTQDRVKDAGTYTISVTLDGSLSEKYFIPTADGRTSFTIKPYEITLNWKNTDLVYSGYAQTPSFDLSTIEGSGDSLSTVMSSGHDSVGTYNVTVSWYGVSSSNYTIVNPSCEYTISPKPLTVTWEDRDSYTYSGTKTYPSATLQGVISGQSVPLSYAGAGKDVGSYTVTVSHRDSNYTLVGELSKQYEILPRVLSVSWDSITSFEYNGKEQRPEAIVYGEVAGETVNLVYTGAEKEVGDYTVTVSQSNPNYTLSDTNEDFTIYAKRVEFRWGIPNLTYNGQIQCPTVSLSGVVAGDSVDIIKSGDYATSKNAGDNYSMSATINNPNYELSGTTSVTYKINPKTLTVTWSAEREFVYNGKIQCPTASLSGVVAGDSVDIIKSGDYATSKNAGDNYSMSATINNPNYELSGTTQVYYEIKAKGVTITWNNEGEYIFDGTVKCPTVTITDGVVAGDICSATLVGADNAVTVGEYSVTVMLNNSNYFIESGETTASFKIVEENEQE